MADTSSCIHRQHDGRPSTSVDGAPTPSHRYQAARDLSIPTGDGGSCVVIDDTAALVSPDTRRSNGPTRAWTRGTVEEPTAEGELNADVASSNFTDSGASCVRLTRARSTQADRRNRPGIADNRCRIEPRQQQPARAKSHRRPHPGYFAPATSLSIRQTPATRRPKVGHRHSSEHNRRRRARDGRTSGPSLADGLILSLGERMRCPERRVRPRRPRAPSHATIQPYAHAAATGHPSRRRRRRRPRRPDAPTANHEPRAHPSRTSREARR